MVAKHYGSEMQQYGPKLLISRISTVGFWACIRVCEVQITRYGTKLRVRIPRVSLTATTHVLQSHPPKKLIPPEIFQRKRIEKWDRVLSLPGICTLMIFIYRLFRRVKISLIKQKHVYYQLCFKFMEVMSISSQLLLEQTCTKLFDGCCC